jgi:hypothetical protein
VALFGAVVGLPACSARPVTVADANMRSGVVASTSRAAVTLDAMTRAVRTDAAEILRLADLGASLTVRVETVTWSDGSLGCPQPDRVYTQAIVPGWRLTVGDGTREWVYHASRRGQWVLCPAARARPPLPEAVVR